MQDESAAALQVQEDLKNLLRFVQQLLATRDKRVFDIAEYPLRLTERDLMGRDGGPLPGIKFAASDDRWISFDRLQEIRPPVPAADLQPWLREETRPTPDKPPALRPERIVQVTAEEATDLIEAGFASIDSVGLVPAGDARDAERWAVPLRPSGLPLIVEAHEAYVAGPWTAWADQEAPRRRAMKLYEDLYKAHAQIAAAGGEGGQELVIGIGLASWKPNGTRLILPLIEQRAEFELNESNGTLSILPRDAFPTISLASFMELGITGVPLLQRDMASRLEQIAKDPDISFSPFQPASFKPILETCAARLDSSGTVLPPEEELGPPGDVLRISPTFCIIVRTRRSDVITDDINRLITAVEKSTSLPETGCRFVVPASDRLADDIEPINPANPLGGTNGSSAGDRDGPWSDGRGKPRDWLYFPRAANEEQEEIARRLDRPDVHGVVVQGPPGTGKTHTIANIIGHWMATGRRVLVAAHTAEALTAIRDKLPSALSDLSIAVTHTDREGARQLEHAVSTLARRVQSINPRELKRRTDDLLRAISASDHRVCEIDAELAAIARENLTERPWRGGQALPHEIAAWKCSQGERHAWFPDRLDLVPDFEPCFGDAEIDEARALRRRLGEDIAYRVDTLPSGSGGLPGLGAIVAAHRALRSAAERQSRPMPNWLRRMFPRLHRGNSVSWRIGWSGSPPGGTAAPIMGGCIKPGRRSRADYHSGD